MQAGSVKKQNCHVRELIQFKVQDQIVTQLLSYVFVFLQVVCYDSGCFSLENLYYFISINLAVAFAHG